MGKKKMERGMAEGDEKGGKMSHKAGGGTGDEDTVDQRSGGGVIGKKAGAAKKKPTARLIRKVR